MKRILATLALLAVGVLHYASTDSTASPSPPLAPTTSWTVPIAATIAPTCPGGQCATCPMAATAQPAVQPATEGPRRPILRAIKNRPKPVLNLIKARPIRRLFGRGR